jgi:hypothetical protein
LYVPFAVLELTAVTVGPVESAIVVSMVTLDAVASAAGPELGDAAVSETLLAASFKTTVPGPVHVTVTVIEIPDDALGLIVQPVAVPV